MHINDSKTEKNDNGKHHEGITGSREVQQCNIQQQSDAKFHTITTLQREYDNRLRI